MWLRNTRYAVKCGSRGTFFDTVPCTILILQQLIFHISSFPKSKQYETRHVGIVSKSYSHPIIILYGGLHVRVTLIPLVNLPTVFVD